MKKKKTCTSSVNGPVTGIYYISGEGIEEIPCKIARKKPAPRKQIKDEQE